MAHEYSNPLGYEHQVGNVAGTYLSDDVFSADARKAIEAAVKFLNVPTAGGERRVALSVLINAARKHLETLPKPAPPKFQVVGVRYGARETYNFRFTHKEFAVAQAAEWMATGKYSGVAIEEV